MFNITVTRKCTDGPREHVRSTEKWLLRRKILILVMIWKQFYLPLKINLLDENEEFTSELNAVVEEVRVHPQSVVFSCDICDKVYRKGTEHHYVFSTFYRHIRESKSSQSMFGSQSLQILLAGKSEIPSSDHNMLTQANDRGGLWAVTTEVFQVFQYVES